jgi:HD-GYP domain-containing protein (c-di-GMP phosphodiesterase class II)
MRDLDAPSLNQRAERLKLLLRLGLEFHAEREFPRLLDRIWGELTRVLHAERSSLFLVDLERGELYSVIAQQEEEIRFPVGKGVAGAVVSSGESILVPEAYADPRFNPEVDQKTGFRTRSLIASPLRNRRGEILGVAQVLNRVDGRPFDEEDRDLLEALCSVAAVAIETVQLYEEQRKASEAVITGFLTALEMRDPASQRHSLEVRDLARRIAQQMGLPEEETQKVAWAAALHDLGKIAVPDEILSKKGPLSPDERRQYEAHAIHTRRLLQSMSFSGELEGIEAIAPYHHKRFQGGGYPEGPPEGMEVPLGARIIAVADALWWKMNPRWGEPPLSVEDATAWIRDRAGSDFDPAVVEALLRLVSFEETRKQMDER